MKLLLHIKQYKHLLFHPIIWLLIPVFLISFISSAQTINPDYSIRGILFFLYFFLLALYFLKNKYSISFFNPLVFISFFLLLVMAFNIYFALNLSLAIKSTVNYSLFPLSLFLFSTLFKTTAKSPEIVSFLISFFVLILVIFSFYQIYQVFFMEKSVDLITIYDIRSTLNHKNLFSHILVLSIPFTMYNIYKNTANLRTLYFFILFISVVLIVLIMTRSTWIAFVIYLFFTISLFLWNKKQFSIKKKSKQLFKGILLLFILSIIFSYVILSLTDKNKAFQFQLSSLSNMQNQNIEKRVFLWKNTVNMIKEHAIWGVGPGNWSIYIPKYALDDAHNNNGEVRYQSPHNDFLSMLAENGIITFLLFVSIFIIAFFYGIRILRNGKTLDDRIFSLFIVGAINTYMLISFLSPVKEYAETLLLFSVILSLLIAKNIEIKDDVLKIKQVRFSVLILVLLVFISVFGFYYRTKVYFSEKYTKLAVGHLNHKQYELCVYDINKAYSKYTNCDPTSTPLKWYSGNAQFSLKNFTQALSDYQTAYSQSPYNSFVLSNMAATYAVLGELKYAEEYYEKSLKIRPNNNQNAINLIKIYIKQGHFEKAKELGDSMGYHKKNNPYNKWYRKIH